MGTILMSLRILSLGINPMPSLRKVTWLSENTWSALWTPSFEARATRPPSTTVFLQTPNNSCVLCPQDTGRHWCLNNCMFWDPPASLASLMTSESQEALGLYPEAPTPLGHLPPSLWHKQCSPCAPPTFFAHRDSSNEGEQVDPEPGPPVSPRPGQ